MSYIKVKHWKIAEFKSFVACNFLNSTSVALIHSRSLLVSIWVDFRLNVWVMLTKKWIPHLVMSYFKPSLSYGL